MRHKRYTGRRNSVRKTIAALLVLGGLALVFGGAGSLEKDYLTLAHGLIVMGSGAAVMVGGLFLGGEI